VERVLESRAHHIAATALGCRMRPIHFVAAVLATALLTSLATLALTAQPTSAQPTPTTPVAIAPGPSGMWIAYGNRVVICVQSTPEITGQPPPAPRCGAPTRLP
jgi:hypothetical protein